MKRIWIFSGLAMGLLFWQLVACNMAQQGRVAQQNNPPSATGEAQTEVERLEAWVESDPNSAEANAQLGLAYLQTVRESGDAGFYVSAENHLNHAVEADPNSLNALVGQGILAAARHDFRAALDWAHRAHDIAPHNTVAMGVLVDAYVELGDYENAVQWVDRMNTTRPGLNAYSRMSYVRELYGDVDGAIAAMEAAVNAGVPADEPMLWSLVQLGDLHLRYGDPEEAQQAYMQALQLQPDYAYALDGQARVAIEQGDFAAAIEILEPLVERFPMPQFAWTLGDAFAAVRDEDSAENAWNLVRAMNLLNEGAGMNVELELVLFDAEHGDDIDATVDLARAVYAERPTVYAADALAWSLYHAGNYTEAQTYSEIALSLGTRDPQLFAHAAAIAEQLNTATTLD